MDGVYMGHFNRVEVPATYDVEASYGEDHGRVSNCFGGQAALCCWGYKHADEQCVTDYFVREDTDGYRTGDHDITPLPIRSDVSVLVGANIKFDLLWVLSRPGASAVWDFLRRGGRIWDISYAEYLLSGQAVNNKNIDKEYRCSLNAVAKLNGIDDQKIDVVAELWAAGIRTEDVPEDTLLEYQVGDVDLTYRCYLSQVKRAKEMGPVFYNNLISRMDGMVATMWMEFNGLHVDKQLGLDIATELEAEKEDLLKQIHAHLPDDCPEEYNFNPGSTQQLSAFLFGGLVKYVGKVDRTDKFGNKIMEKIEVPKWLERERIEVQTGEYYTRGKNAGLPKTEFIWIDYAPGEKQARYTAGKNKGQLKFEKVDHPTKVQQKNGDKFYYFPGFGYDPVEKYALESGGYSTAAEHMEALSAMYPEWDVIQLIDRVTSLQKDLGTYYITTAKNGNQKGMLTTINPDGCIHHSLQHYITATTRLSCTKPNLQNIPSGRKSKVKSVFTSRFGKDGSMVEIDYSQLEVVTKAALSGDPVIKQDLEDGVCFHCKNLALAEGLPYEYVYRKAKEEKDPVWTDKRQAIKNFTFQDKYGGGAASMAEKTGLPVETIKNLMEEKKKVYHVEAAFDQKVFDTACLTRVNSPFRTPKGNPAGIGYYLCPTGTVYGFIEDDAPKWKQEKEGVLTGIKPTQTKNYPSQGLGGFIMQDALGAVARWLLDHPKLWPYVKLVNTVHDCMWMDVHNDYLWVIPVVRDIMEDVNTRFNKMCGDLGWGVPFPAEAEAGPNMLELEHVH